MSAGGRRELPGWWWWWWWMGGAEGGGASTTIKIQKTHPSTRSLSLRQASTNSKFNVPRNSNTSWFITLGLPLVRKYCYICEACVAMMEGWMGATHNCLWVLPHQDQTDWLTDWLGYCLLTTHSGHLEPTKSICSFSIVIYTIIVRSQITCCTHFHCVLLHSSIWSLLIFWYYP